MGKYKVMRDRELMLTPLYWNNLSQTSQRSKDFFGVNQVLIYSHLKDGRDVQFHLSANWRRAEKIIADNYFNNQHFFDNLEIVLSQKAKAVDIFLKRLRRTNFQALSPNALVSWAADIQDSWLAYDGINVPAWFWGADEFSLRLQKLLPVSPAEYLIISTPDVNTYASRLEYDLLRKWSLVKTSKLSLESAAQSLSDNYGWLPFGYDGPKYWDNKYFLRQLKALGRNYKRREAISQEESAWRQRLRQKKNIIKRYHFTKKELRYLEIINKLAIWTDERKNLEFQLHYHYARVLWSLEKKLGISYINLKYLFTEELPELLKNKDKFIKISSLRLRSDFMFATKNGKIRILSASEKNKILREISQQNKEQAVKGKVASSGAVPFYEGQVKILLSPADGDKVQIGDIIIATMTSPDYIVAMKRAGAFITDEGGVTCHAAIVAREMHKPCLIATKIATKKFKDNDRVRMDLQHGTVTLI